MDNQNSRPALELPVIPPDFESQVGTSKTDFVRAIFDLLSATTITGINQENPEPYDLSAMQKSIEALQKDVEDMKSRKPTRLKVHGVNNGPIVITFPSVGTNDYQVDVAFLTPNVNFDPIQWSIIEGSKTPTQVQLRLDGRAGPFNLEVTITPLTGLPI